MVGNLSSSFTVQAIPQSLLSLSLPLLLLLFMLSFSFSSSLFHTSFILTTFFSLSLSLSQIKNKIFSAPGMSLRAYFPTEFACGYVFDRKEREVPLIDETNWESRHKGGSMDLHHHAIEFDIDFWPVEHPMEPQDEDRPVKCPMPSTAISEGKGHEERAVAAESFRKRLELPEMVKKGIAVATEPPVRAVRKRLHHTLTRDDHTMRPLVRMPSFPSTPNSESYHFPNSSGIRQV